MFGANTLRMVPRHWTCECGLVQKDYMEFLKQSLMTLRDGECNGFLAFCDRIIQEFVAKVVAQKDRTSLLHKTLLYSAIATFPCSQFFFQFFVLFLENMALHYLISVHRKSLICLNWKCQVAWALSLLHGRMPQGEKRFHPCRKTHHQQKTFRVSKWYLYICGMWVQSNSSIHQRLQTLRPLATKMAWPPRSWVISLPSLAHATWHVMPMPLSNWAKRRDLAMVKGW